MRDYLRQHPVKAQEYGDLKKRLAQEHPYDMALYVEGKTPFIGAILREAGFDNASLERIAQANKASSKRPNATCQDGSLGAFTG